MSVLLNFEVIKSLNWTFLLIVSSYYRLDVEYVSCPISVITAYFNQRKSTSKKTTMETLVFHLAL